VVLVGEEEEAGEVPRARWCSGSQRRGRRWSVGGWRRGGGHRRGWQSAAGGKEDSASSRSQGNGIGFSFGL
jgi:hypothetical protein